MRWSCGSSALFSERERDSLAGRAEAIRGDEIMKRRRADSLAAEETDITDMVMSQMQINTG